MRKGGTTIPQLIITVQTRGLDGIFTETGAILMIKITDGTLTIEHRRAATTIGILKVVVPQDPELTRISTVMVTDFATRIAVIIYKNY